VVLTVGNVEIQRVEELRIPNSIGYFTQDRTPVAMHRHWLSPFFLDAEDRFDLVFQSRVFVSDDRVVLVDPCTGNGRPHPVAFFDQLDVPFLDRLAAVGFQPQDIDLVVCTHLHHDHCGWNTQLRDGKWVPTFPDARYILRQEEFDRWGQDRNRYPPSRTTKACSNAASSPWSKPDWPTSSPVASRSRLA
jgi:glyoxylase-like metal-dependent hydrolase (beta-lactamase superfamily II)